jgi:hypothetical protein
MNPPRPVPRRSSFAGPQPMPPDWTRRALCRHWPRLDWIDPTPQQARQCRALCSGCPVRRQCLATALATAEPWGIWGGLDVDERAELAHRYGLAAPRVLPAHGVHSRYVRHGCRCDACRYAHARYERERRHALQQRAAQLPTQRAAARHQARQRRTRALAT